MVPTTTSVSTENQQSKTQSGQVIQINTNQSLHPNIEADPQFKDAVKNQMQRQQQQRQSGPPILPIGGSFQPNLPLGN